MDDSLSVTSGWQAEFPTRGRNDKAPRTADCRKAPRGMIVGTRAQRAGISFTLTCCICGALSYPADPATAQEGLGPSAGLGILAKLSTENRVRGEDPSSPSVEVIDLLVE